MPTQLEWQEMKVNMDVTLNGGPDVGAKNTLSAAFAILVLRGRALLDMQNQIQAKLTELIPTREFTTHKKIVFPL